MTDNRTNDPTEAQVEAAAKAIADCYNPGMFERYPENWRVEARAALAAADAHLPTVEQIAELHALCDDRLWGVEKHAERMEAERDAALARIAEAAKLHRNAGPSQGYDSRFKGGYGMLGDCCATCGSHGEYGVEWPCPTAIALGLSEGENND